MQPISLTTIGTWEGFMKKSAMLFTIILFGSFLPSAYAAGIELAVGGWQQNPSGTISYTGDDSVAADDKIDIVDDLNYDSESRFIGRIKIDMPLMFPNINIIAAPMEFEGTGQKNVDFTFGDIDFSANVDFDSKITLNQYDFALYYGIPGIKTATSDVLNIDLGINARYVDFSAEISGEPTSAPGTTVSEKESLSIVIPMVYAGVQITPVKWLSFEAEGRGISISGNSLYSVIGRVRVKVAGPAFIAGGYRYDELDIDESDVQVKARFAGPFVEVGLKF
jgi:outer membrane protein